MEKLYAFEAVAKHILCAERFAREILFDGFKRLEGEIDRINQVPALHFFGMAMNPDEHRRAAFALAAGITEAFGYLLRLFGTDQCIGCFADRGHAHFWKVLQEHGSGFAAAQKQLA